MHLLLSCWWTIGSQIRGSRSRKGQKTNIYMYERITAGSALCRGCKCWMRTNICFAIRQISLRTGYFTPDFIEADFPPHFSKLDWCVPISVHDSLNFQHCRQRKCGFFLQTGPQRRRKVRYLPLQSFHKSKALFICKQRYNMYQYMVSHSCYFGSHIAITRLSASNQSGLMSV